jgi:hypothetical protein
MRILIIAIPFGRVVVRKPGADAGSVIGNIIWFLHAGHVPPPARHQRSAAHGDARIDQDAAAPLTAVAPSRDLAITGGTGPSTDVP